ncbi:tRNA pseudouridine(13) synthase TruD [Saliphagus sp. LR7]|uniref:tRNA pseudouridine(13) synthase TruD n=1 Tax=Saliphagus sp. LR7 TaxID=2282654 RepID=UPI000DF7AA64|nr:tRNA pseudouridine(13) synthase TruD [Saliphagus sp. LR7]
MRPAHPTEEAVGIEGYASEADGVGGRLRGRDDRFRVRELEAFPTELLDASTDAYPHLVFRATLSNWDTNDFAKRLSDALEMSRERVSWAGTKDKYARTTQLFSIDAPDLAPADLPEIDGAGIEPIGRAGRGLEFGDLAGNAFDIVVDDPERPENAPGITEELAAFAGDGGPDSGDGEDEAAEGDGQAIGVPNFFGQQRFGSRRPVTHAVGLEIVRGDWEGAVMAYLGGPTADEPEQTQEARRFVEDTRDWQDALEEFPRGLGYERSMLHELAGHGEEPDPDVFRAAIEKLPSNLQRLFVHAAQSYAFNRICSERLRRELPFDRPVEGDVVCFLDGDLSGELAVPDPDRSQRVTDRRVESVARHCARGRAFVTAPLVGTDTELADGEQGEIEREVLDELDLAPADFDLSGEFHSTGTRRAILVRTKIEVEHDPLEFSFALPKGAYATVVAREYMKVDPIDMG